VCVCVCVHVCVRGVHAHRELHGSGAHAKLCVRRLTPCAVTRPSSHSRCRPRMRSWCILRRPWPAHAQVVHSFVCVCVLCVYVCVRPLVCVSACVWRACSPRAMQQRCACLCVRRIHFVRGRPAKLSLAAARACVLVHPFVCVL